MDNLLLKKELRLLMGFYLRKSINLGGGVRLNLSNSGLGVSAGVRGFRVGMNGRGTYVHMGAGGLYYRQQFSYSKSRRSSVSQPHRTPAPSHDVVSAFVGATQDLVRPIDIESSAADKDHILNHFRPRTNPIPFIAGGITAIGLFALTQSTIIGSGVLLASFGLFGYAAISKSRDVLVYNLEGLACERFEAFVATFDEYFRSDRKWLYETHTPNFDWKRNAGASAFIKRTLAVLTTEEDPRLRVNISVPRMISGRNRVYFLPDTVVVQGADGSLRAVDYPNIEIDSGRSTFIEEEGVPRDAHVVGHTWKFVRKDGGPDRRFNNNRQIPICSYQQTVLLTFGGSSRTFVHSRLSDERFFRDSLHRMREQIIQVTPTEKSEGVLLITHYSRDEHIEEKDIKTHSDDLEPSDNVNGQNNTELKLKSRTESQTKQPLSNDDLRAATILRSERNLLMPDNSIISTHQTLVPKPFGIEFGSSIDGLRVVQDLGSSKFHVEAPSPHPLFSSYLVEATPRLGVVWIKGISDLIENDNYGAQARQLIDKVAEQLSGKYGVGKKTDLLLTGSIWSEAKYWTSGVNSKERFYSYLWGSGGTPLRVSELYSIYVGAVASDMSNASVHIEYASPRMKEAEAENDQSMADLL